MDEITMTSISFVVHAKLAWECCPPELLRIIFKNLDYSSLKHCMTVNRRWRDAAVDYIEFYGLWPKIVSEVLINKGSTFRMKSRLDWKDILINSILWSSVRSAQVEHRNTCRVKNFMKMNMYKDLLIVKTNNYIKYFNSNFDAVRHYKCYGEDWTENDFMKTMRDHELSTELCPYLLHLWGKINPDDCEYRHTYMHTAPDILLHRLEDNICYTVTDKNVVWALQWDGKKWHHQLRGRYYGNKSDTIHAMHVFNNNVSMVTKYGKILCEEPESKSFKVVVSHSNVTTGTNWVLFNNSDVAVSVPGNKERKRITREMISDHMKLECADLSCATEHGEIFFLGFKDGVVAICNPSNMRLDRCEPELYLDVKHFAENIMDPTILAIEVFEDKLCHHLFIAIPDYIHHFILRYPLNITTYYD